MNEKLISVIVPVYNCEKYLKRCLDSLMAQTLREMEFILIDDGSTDRSGEILREYQKRDSRFSVICQENRGICGSRNSGLLAVRGVYVGFVDADDYVEPEMFQILLERISATQSDVAICDYAITYPQYEMRDVLKLTDGSVDAASLGQDLFYLRYFGKNPELWNKLYRRSLIEENKIRFEVGYGEDLLFQLRLMPYVGRLCTVQATLYHYIQRKSSVAHSLDRRGGENITMLQKYLEGNSAGHASERIAELAFSTVFTGFLFSASCIGRRPGYFYDQVQNFRKWDQIKTTASSGGLSLALKGPITGTPKRWYRKPSYFCR